MLLLRNEKHHARARVERRPAARRKYDILDVRARSVNLLEELAELRLSLSFDSEKQQIKLSDELSPVVIRDSDSTNQLSREKISSHTRTQRGNLRLFTAL